MVITSQHILLLARLYGEATNTPQVTVSSRVFGDSKKLAAMENHNADLTLRRAAHALQWFSDNWPEGVEWPDDIARPFDVRGAA